jgi:hypothetical protein
MSIDGRRKEPPNNALQRRPRNQLLIQSGMPFAAPLNAGVRRLRTMGGKDGKMESPVLSCESSGMGH